MLSAQESRKRAREVQAQQYQDVLEPVELAISRACENGELETSVFVEEHKGVTKELEAHDYTVGYHTPDFGDAHYKICWAV